MEIGKPKKTKVVYKIKEELVGSVQHPVSDLLVLAAKSGAWSFVDLAVMKEVLRVNPFSDKKVGFSCVALHPDGEYLASGATNGMIAIWGITENELAVEFQAHKNPVTSLAFSERGRYFASADSKTNEVKIWDLGDLEQGHTIQLQKGFVVKDLSFDPSGFFLAVSGKHILLFEEKGWKNFAKIDCHQKAVTSVR